MKVSEKLCITMDYNRITKDNVEVLQIGDFAFDNYKGKNIEDIQIPNIPLPDGIKELLDPSVLLIFKRVSKSKAKMIWVYNPTKSILYDTNGKRASKKDMRRFMQLMFGIWLSPR